MLTESTEVAVDLQSLFDADADFSDRTTTTASSSSAPRVPAKPQLSSWQLQRADANSAAADADDDDGERAGAYVGLLNQGAVARLPSAPLGLFFAPPTGIRKKNRTFFSYTRFCQARRATSTRCCSACTSRPSCGRPFTPFRPCTSNRRPTSIRHSPLQPLLLLLLHRRPLSRALRRRCRRLRRRSPLRRRCARKRRRPPNRNPIMIWIRLWPWALSST